MPNVSFKPRKNSIKTCVVYLSGLHGHAVGHPFGDAVEKYYGDRNISTLLIDYPCHGDDIDNFANFTITEAVEFVVSEINKALEHEDVEDIAFIGGSFAAWVALLAAIRLPKFTVSNMVFMDPMVGFIGPIWNNLSKEEQGFVRENGWTQASGSDVFHVHMPMIEDAMRPRNSLFFPDNVEEMGEHLWQMKVISTAYLESNKAYGILRELGEYRDITKLAFNSAKVSTTLTGKKLENYVLEQLNYML